MIRQYVISEGLKLRQSITSILICCEALFFLPTIPPFVTLCHTSRRVSVRGFCSRELAKCLFRVQKFRALIPYSTHYGVGGLAGAMG